MYIALPIFYAALLSFLFTPLVIRFAKKFELVDDPKKRYHPAHTHKSVIPRAGGLAVFLSILLASLFMYLCYDRCIMKRKLGFLLILLGIIALIVFIVRFFISSRTPKTGILKVSSSPAASVFLDNKHVGRTPYESEVASGEYTIKLVPDVAATNVAPWQGKVKVAGSLLTYVNRDLAPTELVSAGEVLWLEKITSSTSELTVTTIPDSATILLDEQEQGVTPLTIPNVSPGDHNLTVTSPGFLSRTLKIRATAGYKLSAAIQLALSPLDTPDRQSSSSASASDSATLQLSNGNDASSSGVNPRKPFVQISQTPTGFLRVRENPTTTSAEVGRVKPGEKYTILEESDGWYKINYEGDSTGWVAAEYTDVTK